MFNQIKLPSYFKNKDKESIVYEISKNDTSFSFDLENFDIIFDNIKESEEYAILFLIHQMVCNNDFIYPIKDKSYGGLPTQGQFEFENPNTNLGIEVYHAHINRESRGVLIWYHIFDDLGLRLKFEYHRPHPTDNYKSILKRIMNHENSYSPEPFMPLLEKHNYLRENLITKFAKFIKL